MSFFTNNRTDRCPGPITGNPLTGLCERVCINTSKVFDSCMSQIHIENISLDLEEITPETVVYPLTFVSCASNGPATVTDLVIDRFEDRPNFARITANINIPVLVNFTDANGVVGTGTTTLTINKDVVMCVPSNSVIPFTVEGYGAMVCSDGEFTGETSTVVIDGCVTVILRVLANADILVPSYGYCQIPQCQDYSQEVCEGVFDLPLYPTNA
ncbi:MAG: hypothetical protein KBT30_01395 [Clostridiales bacterium]|nr:hypothetical protein [Candidatus Apopatousia equi]